MDENNNVNLPQKNDKPVIREKSTLPVWALLSNFFAVVFFFLGILTVFIGFPISFIGLLSLLAAVSCPFIAIILGVCSLCLGKQRIGSSGIVCSILAIAIPVIALIVTIFLFGTGVAVIRWM